jgi:gluconate 2-dehydrogenase subunit 3-like protein
MALGNVLTDSQRSLLVAVLNRIIPAEESAPAAGSTGAVEAIEAEVAASPGERRLFLDGVSAVDLVAWRTRDRGFPDLEADDQDEVLRAVEAENPSFFSFLVTRTYRAYYTNSSVLAALGIESRPPQPLGHSLPPFDPSLLARARERGTVYRKIGDEG